MGNPSNCPIWSRGHCVLWSFYLWIGSAFSKPENIFELRLLTIRFRFGFKRGTRSAAKLPSDRSHWSFLIFPVNGVWLAPWPLQQAIGNSGNISSTILVGVQFRLIVKCTTETPVVPPHFPLPPHRCSNSVSVNAQSRLSEHEASSVRELNQIKHCVALPATIGSGHYRVLLSTRSVNCSLFKLKSERRCIVTK